MRIPPGAVGSRTSRGGNMVGTPSRAEREWTPHPTSSVGHPLPSERAGGFHRLAFIRFKAGAFHAASRLRILHKDFPDKPRTQILRHQQGDSGVNPDGVAIVPALERVEGIYESILAPGAGSISRP